MRSPDCTHPSVGKHPVVLVPNEVARHDSGLDRGFLVIAAATTAQNNELVRVRGDADGALGQRFPRLVKKQRAEGRASAFGLQGRTHARAAS